MVYTYNNLHGVDLFASFGGCNNIAVDCFLLRENDRHIKTHDNLACVIAYI